jgi:hypothetical protein
MHKMCYVGNVGIGDVGEVILLVVNWISREWGAIVVEL